MKLVNKQKNFHGKAYTISIKVLFLNIMIGYT